MKFKALSVLLLLAGLWPARASADNRFIVRTTLDLQTLQTVCNPPLLPPICTVVRGLGDPLGRLFLITSSQCLEIKGRTNDEPIVRRGFGGPESTEKQEHAESFELHSLPSLLLLGMHVFLSLGVSGSLKDL